MPFDAVYEDLIIVHSALLEQYSKVVDNLIALQSEGKHNSFAATAALARDLAAQVEAAREKATAHRRASEP
jgi:primosomal protein N''